MRCLVAVAIPLVVVPVAGKQVGVARRWTELLNEVVKFDRLCRVRVLANLIAGLDAGSHGLARVMDNVPQVRMMAALRVSGWNDLSDPPKDP